MQTETPPEQGKSGWGEAIAIGLYFGAGVQVIEKVLSYWLIYELRLPLAALILLLCFYPLHFWRSRSLSATNKRPLTFISHAFRSILIALAAFLFILLANLVFEGRLFEAR